MAEVGCSHECVAKAIHASHRHAFDVQGHAAAAVPPPYNPGVYSPSKPRSLPSLQYPDLSKILSPHPSQSMSPLAKEQHYELSYYLPSHVTPYGSPQYLNSPGIVSRTSSPAGFYYPGSITFPYPTPVPYPSYEAYSAYALKWRPTQRDLSVSTSAGFSAHAPVTENKMQTEYDTEVKTEPDSQNVFLAHPAYGSVWRHLPPSVPSKLEGKSSNRTLHDPVALPSAPIVRAPHSVSNVSPARSLNPKKRKVDESQLTTKNLKRRLIEPTVANRATSDTPKPQASVARKKRSRSPERKVSNAMEPTDSERKFYGAICPDVDVGQCKPLPNVAPRQNDLNFAQFKSYGDMNAFLFLDPPAPGPAILRVTSRRGIDKDLVEASRPSDDAWTKSSDVNEFWTSNDARREYVEVASLMGNHLAAERFAECAAGSLVESNSENFSDPGEQKREGSISLVVEGGIGLPDWGTKVSEVDAELRVLGHMVDGW